MEPYYDQDGVTLYHGDALEVLASLPAKSFDLVVADPPYNVGMTYRGYDDAQPVEAYRQWSVDWLSAAQRVSKRQVVFPGLQHFDSWCWLALEGKIKRWSGTGCWFKPGNFRSGHLGGDDWEPFFYWGKRVGGSSVVRATVGRQKDAEGHPCPKPLALVTALLTKLKATNVLDPFVGSGTTVLAARNCGIPSVGVDTEAAYLDIAVRRLQHRIVTHDGIAYDQMPLPVTR